MIIYLIGARGSGKTTVGQYLARRLRFPFVDLDRSLCDSLGKNIEEVVAEQGWSAFRKLESEHLGQIAGMAKAGNLMAATGGGVILEEKNRNFMRKSGRVIWLNAGLQTLLRRLESNPLNGQRPSLSGRPLLEEMEDILREREPIYRACCHLEVNGDKQPEEICQDILSHLGKLL